MIARHVVTTLTAVALTACHIGTRVSSFGPAIDPAGVTVYITSGRSSFQAELLAVRDTGLLLLRNRTLVFARYQAIREATFEQVPDVIERGVAPDRETRQRLRLISRFPAGVSPDRLSSLLAAYGQQAVDVESP